MVSYAAMCRIHTVSHYVPTHRPSTRENNCWLKKISRHHYAFICGYPWLLVHRSTWTGDFFSISSLSETSRLAVSSNETFAFLHYLVRHSGSAYEDVVKHFRWWKDWNRMIWLLWPNSGMLCGVLLASLLLTSADVCLSRNLFLAKMRPRKHPMDFSAKRLVIIFNKINYRTVIKRTINLYIEWTAIRK